MKLTAPKVITFVIAVALGVLAFIGRFAPSVALIGPYNFWLMFIGWLVLVFGVLIKGL